MKDVARERRELYRSMHEVRTTQQIQQSRHQQPIEQVQPTALAHGAVDGAAERFPESSLSPQSPQHHFRFGAGYAPVIPRRASAPAHGGMNCQTEAFPMRGSNATSTVGSWPITLTRTPSCVIGSVALLNLVGTASLWSRLHRENHTCRLCEKRDNMQR